MILAFRARDEFDEWLRTPVPSASPDPRIEVRRAQPAEFERIYDVIDDAFGFQRPRALSDWLYRRNPYGVARCWISIERATGKLVGSVANWPWPLARGMQPLPAAQEGDAAVVQGWQRQRIQERVQVIRESHPWTRSIVDWSWPNAASRRRISKAGNAHLLLGMLPRRVLPLRSGDYLAGRGLPQPLAAAGGLIVDTLFAAWPAMMLRTRFNGTVERVRRFDAAFDEVTQRCMPWEGYWSPHGAEFLNWRYLDDPVREHVASALMVGTTLTGYSVVRLERGTALLMEFVVPHDQPQAARRLLLHVIKAAADAGCSHLTVSAPPAWRHWRLLRSAGFVARPSDLLLHAFSFREDTPGVQVLENWQLLGGDLDPFRM